MKDRAAYQALAASQQTPVESSAGPSASAVYATEVGSRATREGLPPRRPGELPKLFYKKPEVESIDETRMPETPPRREGRQGGLKVVFETSEMSRFQVLRSSQAPTNRGSR